MITQVVTQIHSQAIVLTDEVGDGVRVGPFTTIEAGAGIGEGCVIGQCCHIESGVALGNGVHIEDGVSVWRGVCLEDDVLVGPNVVFTNTLNPRADRHPATAEDIFQTRVGRGASLGANATILCGHIVGPYAVIGAGSTLTHSMRAHEVVWGNPARHHGWACQCGDILNDIRKCLRCGRGYEMIDTGLRPR